MEQFAPGTPAYDSAADVPPFRLRTPIGSMRKTMLGAFHRTLGCSVSGLSARAVLRALVFLAFGLDASGFASFRSGSTGVAFAQATKSKVAAETIKGKVSAVEVKGKTAKVTISREDGDDLDVLVTPKLAFGVEGKGTCVQAWWCRLTGRFPISNCSAASSPLISVESSLPQARCKSLEMTPAGKWLVRF